MAEDGYQDILDPDVIARLSTLLLRSRFPMLGSVTGVHRSATRGSSVEFAEYRKYVPGDDIKHIDWHVYARSDRFYMKEFEADTNLRCYIILDTSASMAFENSHGSKFEYARRMAATLAYFLIHQGDAVGLHCFSEKGNIDLPARRNPSHLKDLLGTLKTVEAEGKTNIVQTIHELAEKTRQRALVIIISDFFTDTVPLMDCFQHLRFHNHDLAVFHLIDRQELDFDFNRPIRFVDIEGADGLITDPSMIRDGYKEAFHSYLENVKRGCAESQVDYQMVTTDVDYERILSSFLIQRIQKHRSTGS